jgi:hypothetical protein
MPQVQWRGFLLAMACELDAIMPARSRDRLLRAVGMRMAQMRPVPPAASMEALQIEMNEILAELGWGSVRLDVAGSERGLLLTHSGLPRLGVAGHPPGTWLAAVLEGIYGGWMASQPGSEPSLAVELQGAADAATLELKYGW